MNQCLIRIYGKDMQIRINIALLWNTRKERDTEREKKIERDILINRSGFYYIYNFVHYYCQTFAIIGDSFNFVGKGGQIIEIKTY